MAWMAALYPGLSFPLAAASASLLCPFIVGGQFYSPLFHLNFHGEFDLFQGIYCKILKITVVKFEKDQRRVWYIDCIFVPHLGKTLPI